MAESLVVDSIIFTYVELNYDQLGRLVFKGSWNTTVTQEEEVLIHLVCVGIQFVPHSLPP